MQNTPGACLPGVFRHEHSGEMKKWHRSALYGGKTGLQIGKDIIDMLGADGQANGVLVDALIVQQGFIELTVSGRKRKNDKNHEKSKI